MTEHGEEHGKVGAKLRVRVAAKQISGQKDRYGTFERIKQKYKCCRALAKGTQGVARAAVVRAEIADVFYILRLGKNDSKAQRAQQIRCRRAQNIPKHNLPPFPFIGKFVSL